MPDSTDPAADVAELGEREKETAGSGTGQTGSSSDIGQGLVWVVGRERLDDSDASCEGLHIVPRGLVLGPCGSTHQSNLASPGSA